MNIEIELDEDLYKYIVRIVQNTEDFNSISEFIESALREYINNHPTF